MDRIEALGASIHQARMAEERRAMDEARYKSPDSNVEAARQKLLDRSKVGLAKYGVTTERDDLDLVAWLRHLQEELLDAAVYVEAAIKRIEGDKNG